MLRENHLRDGFVEISCDTVAWLGFSYTANVACGKWENKVLEDLSGLGNFYSLSEEGRSSCSESLVLSFLWCSDWGNFLLRSVPCWMLCWVPVWSRLCWQWTRGASLLGKRLTVQVKQVFHTSSSFCCCT